MYTKLKCHRTHITTVFGVVNLRQLFLCALVYADLIVVVEIIDCLLGFDVKTLIFLTPANKSSLNPHFWHHPPQLNLCLVAVVDGACIVPTSEI